MSSDCDNSVISVIKKVLKLVGMLASSLPALHVTCLSTVLLATANVIWGNH